VNENVRPQLRRGVPSLSAKSGTSAFSQRNGGFAWCGLRRLYCQAGKPREMPWQRSLHGWSSRIVDDLAVSLLALGLLPLSFSLPALT
jgi:hypothetical protein